MPKWRSFWISGYCADYCTIWFFIPILQKEYYIVHMIKIISKLFERTGSLHQIRNINIIGGKGINYSVIPKNLIKISDINLDENIINRIQEDYLML